MSLQADSNSDHNYDAMCRALSQLNEYISDSPVSGRESFPTSYMGNPKPLTAKTLEQKIWVAGHGALRDFTGIAGRLLDLDALEKAPAFKIAYAHFTKTQINYHHAAKAILEKAKQYMAEHPDHTLKNVINSRGQPVITVRNQLVFLEKVLSSVEPSSIYDDYHQADKAMSQAMNDMMGLLEQQQSVPLKWVDETGITQHIVLDKKQYPAPNPKDLCRYLLCLQIIDLYGQLDPLTLSKGTQANLDRVNEQSATMEQLLVKFSYYLDAPQYDNVKRYLSDNFCMLPSVHALEALRQDPIARAALKMDGLKNAFEPLHIQDYPVKQIYKEKRNAAPSSCPVGGDKSKDAGSQDASKKHWCVEILEGCQNIPAVHGYGPYR